MFRHILSRASGPMALLTQSFNRGCTERVLLLRNESSNHDNRLLTMDEIVKKLTKSVKSRQKMERKHVEELLKVDQASVRSRGSKESVLEAIIPLASNTELRKQYTSTFGHVRYGCVLQDLDMFAVYIAYWHNRKEEIAKENEDVSPVTFVTLLVDHIVLRNRCSPPSVDNRDLKLRGRVTWVSRSTCEVSMTAWQQDCNSEQMNRKISAKFLMAARSSLTDEPVKINQLRPETAEEKEEFSVADAWRVLRRYEAKQSPMRMAPSAREREVIHRLYLKTLGGDNGTDPLDLSPDVEALPDDCEWMSSTCLHKLVICHPDKMNMYGKIFGGYLMREALELAWITAFMYSRHHPIILDVDDFQFRKPVEIGTVLLFSSQVIYTEENDMVISVRAEVTSPDKATKITTNTCELTFAAAEGVTLLQVIPKTYSESMTYIIGKRHYMRSQYKLQTYT